MRRIVSQTLWAVGGFRPKWCWTILLDQGLGNATCFFFEGSDSKSYSCWKWTMKLMKPSKQKRKYGQLEKKESSSKLLYFWDLDECWLFHLSLSKVPCLKKHSQTSPSGGSNFTAIASGGVGSSLFSRCIESTSTDSCGVACHRISGDFRRWERRVVWNIPETNSLPPKKDRGKGDSYRKPPFVGAMLVSGRVYYTLDHVNDF